MALSRIDAMSENLLMDSNATVTIEKLDGLGHTWRTLSSHMVRGNIDRSLIAIRAGYDMQRTRIKVDGQTVWEPRLR